MIEIYDNFLDEFDFARIQATLLGKDFPWFYQSETCYEELPNDLNDFQFTHIFYIDGEPKSHLFPLIQPIMSKLDAMAFMRIKANLTTISPIVRPGIFHRDYLNDSVITSLFYLQNTNGGTLFENGDRVDCVENRLITFSGPLEHAPEYSSDTKTRCVINFNYFK
jgi:hypothetical protein